MYPAQHSDPVPTCKNRYYHKNVITGALVMVLPSMYPAAPATIHPTASPTMILAFLRNGEPKISVRMMLTKERNPRPMN
jgi:hypothetical protein